MHGPINIRLPSVVDSGIKCWNGTLAERSWWGKVKHQEKSCPLASLSTISPTWTGVGSNPGLQVDTLMTNCGFRLSSLTSGSHSYWVGFWWPQNGSEKPCLCPNWSLVFKPFVRLLPIQLIAQPYSVPRISGSMRCLNGTKLHLQYKGKGVKNSICPKIWNFHEDEDILWCS